MTKSTFARTLLLAATSVSLLGLSACTAENNPFKDVQLPAWMNTNKPAPTQKLVSVNPDCPRVAALPELSRVTQFADETNPVPNTILTETELTKLDSSCITNENSINLDIVLNFTSRLGTAGLSQGAAQASYTHAYFVAVVNPDGSILAKDVFGLSPVFASGQKEVYSSERLQQTIPLSKTVPADKYQIMIGFQLSEGELAYNRALKPREVAPMTATAPGETPKVTPAPARGLSLQPLQPRDRKALN